MQILLAIVTGLALPPSTASQDEPPDLPRRELGTHATRVRQLALAADANALFTADAGGSLYAWDLESAEQLWKSPGVLPPGGVLRRPVHLDAGKKRVVFSMGQAMVQVFDAETGARGQGFGAPNATDVATCIVGDSKDRWAWIGT